MSHVLLFELQFLIPFKVNEIFTLIDHDQGKILPENQKFNL